jgi:hypothetical protein
VAHTRRRIFEDENVILGQFKRRDTRGAGCEATQQQAVFLTWIIVRFC